MIYYYTIFFSYLLLYPSLQLISFNLDFNLHSHLKKGPWGSMFSNPRPLFSSALGVSDKYPLKKRIYWPKLFSKCHATRQALITQWLVPQMTFWSPVIDRAGNSRYICIFPSKIGQFLGDTVLPPLTGFLATALEDANYLVLVRSDHGKRCLSLFN